MPVPPPDADALNLALDRFLHATPPLAHTGMEVFARRAARFLALPSPPRPARPAFARLGIEVTREALPRGLHAVWTCDAGRYRVRLSPFLSACRADFTLWHEWFEIMAARPAFAAVCPEPWAPRRRERVADHFAACLMMPAEAVLRAAEAFPGAAMRGRGDKAAVIAARFGVSVSALRLRLLELRHRRGGPAIR